MFRIELKNNNGFKWCSENNIYFKGNFWDDSGIFYKGNEAVSYFASITDTDQLTQKINRINGLFSLVMQLPDKVFVVSDIIRSIPIFYRKTKTGFYISDDGSTLRNINDTIDPLSEEEFAGTGFVLNNRTLIKEIYQNQAGQILELREHSIQVTEYFNYLTTPDNELMPVNPVQETKTVFLSAFERFVKSLEGRQVVVCLSGGYDSRLIACMLKIFNHRKTLCITYGKREGNPEIALSEKIAKTLGFEWKFIEYTRDLVKEYFDSKEFKAYYNYAGNFSGMFFMHEYFAVKHLKEEKLIDENAIFVAGHSGDFLGGSQIAKFRIKQTMSEKAMVNLLFNKKFVFQPYKLLFENSIKKNLHNDLSLLRSNANRYYSYSIIENWDMKEKLSKFISNSSCVFDVWGYEYRLPFWDKQLTNYFKNLSFRYKENKDLFNAVLKEKFFEGYRLNLKEELRVSQFKIRLQLAKDRIKKMLPFAIIQLFTKKSDHSAYSIICEPLFHELSNFKYISPEKTIILNTVLIQWYLKKIKST